MFDMIHFMQKENWKAIPGFNGRYFISNIGRIKNRDNKVLKQTRNKNGYNIIKIAKSKGEKRKNYRVHRLVLETFIGPAPEDRPITRHLDGNPQNNILENLTWGSDIENTMDKRRHGTFSSKLDDFTVKLFLKQCKIICEEKDVSPVTLGKILCKGSWKRFYEEVFNN